MKTRYIDLFFSRIGQPRCHGVVNIVPSHPSIPAFQLPVALARGFDAFPWCFEAMREQQLVVHVALTHRPDAVQQLTSVYTRIRHRPETLLHGRLANI